MHCTCHFILNYPFLLDLPRFWTGLWPDYLFVLDNLCTVALAAHMNVVGNCQLFLLWFGIPIDLIAHCSNNSYRNLVMSTFRQSSKDWNFIFASTELGSRESSAALNTEPVCSAGVLSRLIKSSVVQQVRLSKNDWSPGGRIELLVVLPHWPHIWGLYFCKFWRLFNSVA